MGKEAQISKQIYESTVFICSQHVGNPSKTLGNFKDQKNINPLLKTQHGTFPPATPWCEQTRTIKCKADGMPAAPLVVREPGAKRVGDVPHNERDSATTCQFTTPAKIGLLELAFAFFVATTQAGCSCPAIEGWGWSY